MKERLQLYRTSKVLYSAQPKSFSPMTFQVSRNRFKCASIANSQNSSLISSKSWHNSLSSMHLPTSRKITKHCSILFCRPHYGSNAAIYRLLRVYGKHW